MSWAGKYCRLTGDTCPGSAELGTGCPWWYEGVEENTATGQTRIVKDCGIVLQQRMLDECAKASRSFAAAVESSRDHVAHVMRGAIGQTIEHTVQAVREEMQLAYERHEQQQLGHVNGDAAK